MVRRQRAAEHSESGHWQAQKEINVGLADRALQTPLVDLGGMIVPGSPDDFGKIVSDETEKWARVIKFAGIKPE